MMPAVKNAGTILLLVALVTLLVASGCARQEARGPTPLDHVRGEFSKLQAEPELASLAPVAVRQAEQAINAAARAEEGTPEYDHLVFMAEQRVKIANAHAVSRKHVNEREELRDRRDRMRLEARAREAEEARREAVASREETERLRQQVEELSARETNRGIVLTLRDVLFDVNEATLKPGAGSELDRLVEFLEEYDSRNIRIQGHTDSTGDQAYNMELSQRRADAVKSYLVSRGIDASRIRTDGRGPNMPIASNNTAEGRQLNRRVEILVERPDIASR